MSRFNALFAIHFSSCPLLAHAHDPYRNRDVELRALPGEFDFVGVTDGTDSWIAPVAGDPFSVSVKKILEGLRAGKMPQPHLRQPRKRLMLAPPPAPEPAPAPDLGPPSTPIRPRRRLLVQA